MRKADHWCRPGVVVRRYRKYSGCAVNELYDWIFVPVDAAAAVHGPTAQTPVKLRGSGAVEAIHPPRSLEAPWRLSAFGSAITSAIVAALFSLNVSHDIAGKVLHKLW